MAGVISLGTQTVTDGSTVAFELAYNDSLQAIELRCDNKTTMNAFCEIKGSDASGESTTAVYGESFPPGLNIISLQTSPPNKVIQLIANPDKPGRYKGFNTYINVPG